LHNLKPHFPAREPRPRPEREEKKNQKDLKRIRTAGKRRKSKGRPGGRRSGRSPLAFFRDAAPGYEIPDIADKVLRHEKTEFPGAIRDTDLNGTGSQAHGVPPPHLLIKHQAVFIFQKVGYHGKVILQKKRTLVLKLKLRHRKGMALLIDHLAGIMRQFKKTSPGRLQIFKIVAVPAPLGSQS
jgi:hypothetical protein